MTEHDDEAAQQRHVPPGAAAGEPATEGPQRRDEPPPTGAGSAGPPASEAAPAGPGPSGGGYAAGWPPGTGTPPVGSAAGWPPPPSGSGPFAAAPRPARELWINPRRRVGTWLIAAGIAVVFFGGGIGAGIGIAHQDRGPGDYLRFQPGPGMMLPGPGYRFGPMPHDWDGTAPWRQGRQGSGPTASTSPGTGSSPSTGATG